MNDLILYHGSKGGLQGAIQPISRDRCDFGKGFYLGESKEQAKGLIAEADSPVLYTIKLHLSEIPEDRILRLSGRDWILAVMANRKSVERFNRSSLLHVWESKLADYDVVIGPIADDRMSEAMKEFSGQRITDKVLEACLLSAQYGDQYVLKSEFACSKAEIVSKKELKGQELVHARHYSITKRREGLNIINETVDRYLGQGKYLRQIIEEEEQSLVEVTGLKMLDAFSKTNN